MPCQSAASPSPRSLHGSALRFGFFDQSHFVRCIREESRHSRFTPQDARETPQDIDMTLATATPTNGLHSPYAKPMFGAQEGGH